MVICLGLLASAQQPSPPQVKVNVLNVCTPSAEEQHEISSALVKVPKQPLFGADFEIDRGRSSLEVGPGFLQPGSGAQMSSDPGVADWVRIRREFSVQALFSTVQYSFSTDPKNMVETLVFRVRDPKDLMQVSIEDSASSVTTPATMLSTSTPASRVKLERFGKSSVLSNYRGLLNASTTVPEELARLGGVTEAKPKPPSAKKPIAKKK